MTNTKYKLRYLPLFYEDLEEKIVHIAEELHNKKAANEAIVKNILRINGEVND